MMYHIDETTEEELIALSSTFIEGHLNLMIFLPGDGVLYNFIIGLN